VHIGWGKRDGGCMAVLKEKYIKLVVSILRSNPDITESKLKEMLQWNSNRKVRSYKLKALDMLALERKNNLKIVDHSTGRIYKEMTHIAVGHESKEESLNNSDDSVSNAIKKLGEELGSEIAAFTVETVKEFRKQLPFLIERHPKSVADLAFNFIKLADKTK